ncbi:Hypothetical protein D9617_3g022210 [Elsinoe fawcettii]|nr:Hypothetical protein D9617_3g022210 [Elsinoe fawcettii]
MGGNAFDQKGPDGNALIIISRLPPSEYEQLKSRIFNVLRNFFARVEVPHEAPEKPDYGDIDFLVQNPLLAFDPKTLKSELCAAAARTSGPVTNFAIPVTVDDDTEKLAQVDVHVCEGNIDWLAFHHAYGDIWQILGTIIRRYGLTANDRGLFVRIKECEDRDWQKSMIFLSQDPAAVLHFLGLEYLEFNAGFKTLQAAYEWLARCGLLDPKAFRETANELRQRNIKTRPMFRRFVEEFIPKLPDPEPDTLPSRRDMLNKALEAFHKREEYINRHATIIAENLDLKANVKLAEALRPADEPISKNLNKNINMVIRAVKRWTRLVNGGLELREEPEMDGAEQVKLRHLLDGEENLAGKHRAWVKEHFEELKSLEKQRMKEAKEARQGQAGKDEEE